MKFCWREICVLSNYSPHRLLWHIADLRMQTAEQIKDENCESVDWQSLVNGCTIAPLYAFLRSPSRYQFWYTVWWCDGDRVSNEISSTVPIYFCRLYGQYGSPHYWTLNMRPRLLSRPRLVTRPFRAHPKSQSARQQTRQQQQQSTTRAMGFSAKWCVRQQAKWYRFALSDVLTRWRMRQSSPVSLLLPWKLVENRFTRATDSALCSRWVDWIW